MESKENHRASTVERADVVVVGARLAGCAVAAPLVRAGRRVVVLDRMTFPSDQLSTHVLVSTGVSEVAQMGALPRLLAHADPTKSTHVRLAVDGVCCPERMRPTADGTAFGLCVPRDLQDVCLVEAVREQGADVRERCTFTGLEWTAGRVSGVRYKDPEGIEREIECDLVVGADGRRSSVAAAVGSWEPYRRSRNGRGLVFRYFDDPLAGSGSPEEATFTQYRDGRSIAFTFPSAPRGRMLVLFMGHRDEASEARRQPEEHWRRKLREHPSLSERVAGTDPASLTKIRSTGETPAFFRASSGPGWALAGDAGHFKDPVIGQGMRDAMWMGRTLAESVLPTLGDPIATDLATREWEARRDEHCLPAYHFANSDTRVETQSPALRELVRDAGRNDEPDLFDFFGRARTPQEIATLPRLTKALGSALTRRDSPWSETIGRALPELRTQLAIGRELRAGRFRETRTVEGSDHPGAPWPEPPRLSERPAAPTPAAGAPAPPGEEIPA